MRKTGAGAGTGAAAQVEQADVDGYAEVYRESNRQLVTYATSLTGSTWVAEDLVAEAHFRVWRRMRAGHAVDNVPAYLMTTVRNLAAGLGRARKEIARDWHELPDGAPNEAVGAIGLIGTVQAQDPEQRASHVDLLARLLKELPGRWASALWYAEVEDLPLEAVGARIGANANTAGVVLARARERLRQAFLQEQPGSPLSADCEQYWKHMAAVVRGTASDRRNKLVLKHAEDCDDCRTRLLALTETNERLPILLGPALLGVVLGGGAWLVPALASAGAGASSAGAGTGARHARQGARAFRRTRSQLLRRGTSNTSRMVVGSFSAVGAVAGVAVVAVALASSSGSSHAAASAAAPTTAAPVSTTATAMAPASSPAAGSVLAPTSAAATTNAAASSSAAPINAAPADTASATATTSADTASSAPATTSTSMSAYASTPSATTTTPANVAPLASTSSGTPSSTSSSTPQNTDSASPTPTVTSSSSSASAQPIVTPTLTPSLTPSLTPTATITPTPSATATATATSTDSCDLQVLIPCVNH